jgi:REP element-mobilizing transposase RayT
MARGNARERIYWDDEDRQRFLDGLSRVCGRFDWILWAYCLMDNHYHLLVETEQPTLSRGMREVNGTYSQSFNRRYGRVGHVLQGRYKAILVDKDAYLTELQRYIVLNPVRAGLCGGAGDWRWSSYPAVMGQAEPLPGLAVDRTLSLFGSERAAARSSFARFVAEGVGQAFEPEVQAQSFLGDENFAKNPGSPLRRPCQQGRQNSSRLPGFSLLLLTRSWLDRPRLCFGMAAALGRTSHHFGLSGLPPSASLPQKLIGSALASMWPVSAAQVTWFASRASNP